MSYLHLQLQILHAKQKCQWQELLLLLIIWAPINHHVKCSNRNSLILTLIDHSNISKGAQCMLFGSAFIATTLLWRHVRYQQKCYVGAVPQDDVTSWLAPNQKRLTGLNVAAGQIEGLALDEARLTTDHGWLQACKESKDTHILFKQVASEQGCRTDQSCSITIHYGDDAKTEHPFFFCYWTWTLPRTFVAQWLRDDTLS